MRFCSPFIHERLPGTGLLLAFALLLSCAVKEPPLDPLSGMTPPPDQVVEPKTEQVPTQRSIFRETGTAVWYGRELHGKKTASGEIFDMYGLTAAHRTLPLGTVLRVTNLDNFKSISVKINDRGPFLKDRFLDLSYGAANELGFVAQGTARVEIEVLDATSGPAQYTVQAAVFTEEESALLLKDRLNTKFRTVSIEPFDTNVARFYRVRVGDYSSEGFAGQVAGKLLLEGLEPIVIRKDR